jgi:hypothetical protein
MTQKITEHFVAPDTTESFTQTKLQIRYESAAESPSQKQSGSLLQKLLQSSLHRRALRNLLPNVLRNLLQNNFTQVGATKSVTECAMKTATNMLIQSIFIDSLPFLALMDLEGINGHQVADGTHHKGLEDTWH